MNFGIHDKSKKRNTNNGLVKHNQETNHNFNFKDSNKLVYIYMIKSIGKLLKQVSFQTTILPGFFQFVSLFDQIGVKKLQNPLFKIIWLHSL